MAHIPLWLDLMEAEVVDQAFHLVVDVVVDQWDLEEGFLDQEGLCWALAQED